MDIDEAFKKCTKCRKTKTGYKISCIKGLFSVYSATKANAEREAKHYFIQYFGDGEYEELL